MCYTVTYVYCDYNVGIWIFQVIAVYQISIEIVLRWLE